MCMLCKCDTVKESTTTHVVNYKGCVIVIRNVPCEECEQCGEKFYTDEVAQRLESIIDAAKKLLKVSDSATKPNPTPVTICVVTT